MCKTNTFVLNLYLYEQKVQNFEVSIDYEIFEVKIDIQSKLNMKDY